MGSWLSYGNVGGPSGNVSWPSNGNASNGNVSVSLSLGPCVYVLQLEEKRFYVGWAQDLQIELAAHRAGQRGDWTATYRPVNVVSTTAASDSSDVDRVVRSLMVDHGMSMVRGGTYSQKVLTEAQENTLVQRLMTATGECFKCGQPGHRATDCTVRQSDDRWNKKTGCFKCGQQGHYSRECPNPVAEAAPPAYIITANPDQLD